MKVVPSLHSDTELPSANDLSVVTLYPTDEEAAPPLLLSLPVSGRVRPSASLLWLQVSADVAHTVL